MSDFELTEQFQQILEREFERDPDFVAQEMHYYGANVKAITGKGDV